MDAAVALLSESAVFSKIIAGGQSLGPMLNLRLAQPDLLVDISSLPELVDVADSRDHVDLGACVTHADVEDGRVPDPSNGLLARVAGTIAYRAVRNRGTLGGSLAHADPAADWVSVFPLLEAEIVVAGRKGRRKVAAVDLMVSSFTTVLEADELIQSIRVPKLSARARWGFYKINQKAGEFAHAIGAVLHDPERRRFRAVLGAIETAPIVIADATELFAGAYAPNLPDRLDVSVVQRLLDQKGVADAYTRAIAPVALKRAARQACLS